MELRNSFQISRDDSKEAKRHLYTKANELVFYRVLSKIHSASYAVTWLINLSKKLQRYKFQAESTDSEIFSLSMLIKVDS